jgi:mRNA-degrading endonuclease toxin of MazEF toxin-antitoxin module
MYVIPERVLKNHDGMDLNKARPVIVISNAESLEYKALILECSTKKHKNSLEFYK